MAASLCPASCVTMAATWHYFLPYDLLVVSYRACKSGRGICYVLETSLYVTIQKRFLQDTVTNNCLLPLIRYKKCKMINEDFESFP